MQTTVIATPKVTTRIRPATQQCVPPHREIVTSNAACCPECGAETRVGLNVHDAVIYGGCVHFQELHQTGYQVSVLFQAGAR